MNLQPVQFRQNGTASGPKADVEQDDVLDTDNSKKLYCVFCHYPVTTLDNAISVNGGHSHTFTNPGGYVYTINCFRTASGCSVMGYKTDEYSWFTGYEWQIALCQSCQQQLGWLFTNSDQFFALIANRLTYEH